MFSLSYNSFTSSNPCLSFPHPSPNANLSACPQSWIVPQPKEGSPVHSLPCPLPMGLCLHRCCLNSLQKDLSARFAPVCSAVWVGLIAHELLFYRKTCCEWKEGRKVEMSIAWMLSIISQKHLRYSHLGVCAYDKRGCMHLVFSRTTHFRVLGK